MSTVRLTVRHYLNVNSPPYRTALFKCQQSALPYGIIYMSTVRLTVRHYLYVNSLPYPTALFKCQQSALPYGNI
jgi:hypothetical protein